MSIKVFAALLVSMASLLLALINWSWPMLVNAIAAYLLATVFAHDEIMRYRK